MPDFALMCPQCQAIVGGGEEDHETCEFIEGMAKAAGLTYLRMLCPPPGTERCGCQPPNPVSRFAVLIQMSDRVELEHTDPKTGKTRKGLPNEPYYALPDLDGKKLSREEAEKELADFEARTGLVMGKVELFEQDLPAELPLVFRRGKGNVKALKAFKTAGHDTIFVVIAVKDKGFYDVVIVESVYGFQVWPDDNGQALKTTDRKFKRLIEDVVFPFLARFQSVTPEKFAAWVEANVKTNAQKISELEDARG